MEQHAPTRPSIDGFPPYRPPNIEVDFNFPSWGAGQGVGSFACRAMPQPQRGHDTMDGLRMRGVTSCPWRAWLRGFRCLTWCPPTWGCYWNQWVGSLIYVKCFGLAGRQDLGQQTREAFVADTPPGTHHVWSQSQSEKNTAQLELLTVYMAMVCYGSMCVEILASPRHLVHR